MKQFHFDVEDATKYGVNAAVILCNFKFWIMKNMADGRNFKDGHYWTYNSRKTLAKLFPFFSEKQIRTATKKLVDEGVLKTGRHNRNRWDQSLWYALVDETEYRALYETTQNPEEIDTSPICPTGHIDWSPESNHLDPEGKSSYTDINTYINKDSPDDSGPPPSSDPFKNEREEIIDHLNQTADTKYKPHSKKSKTAINARLREGYKVQDFKHVIDVKVDEWQVDARFAAYLRPETLFGPKMENYVNQKSKSTRKKFKSFSWGQK